MEIKYTHQKIARKDYINIYRTLIFSLTALVFNLRLMAKVIS